MRITGNSPSNDADGATDRDGADATTGEEEASSFGLSLKKGMFSQKSHFSCLILVHNFENIKTNKEQRTKK